jgi:hypothetical protein
MIVLVTDAGPLEPDEPQASSPLEMPQVRQEAQAKNIFIFPVHLLTEAGVADHEEAEQNYRQLGHFGSDDLYQPVADGSVSAFGAVVDHLAETVQRTVDNMVNQRLNDPGPAGASGAEAADRVGLAMQLAFLGQRLGTRAPDVFEAWLLDKELEKLDRSALEVRLMITKNQLSTLRDVVTALVQGFDGHREAQLDSAVLFQQLRSAVALMSRDPDRVVDAQFRTLGDAMGEYLADLPYTSEVMGLAEQDWAAAGGARQREIIDGLKSKLELYKRYHDSPQLWTDLYPGAPPGEAVFAMPLDALP